MLMDITRQKQERKGIVDLCVSERYLFTVMIFDTSPPALASSRWGEPKHAPEPDRGSPRNLVPTAHGTANIPGYATSTTRGARREACEPGMGGEVGERLG